MEELFRFSQISHYLHTIWKDKSAPPRITPYENWCANSRDQRGGISLLYMTLVSKTDKPSYAWVWEEELNTSWSTAVWHRATERAYKGILNTCLIEASLKVMFRWYYVPSRLARMFPGSSHYALGDANWKATCYTLGGPAPALNPFGKEFSAPWAPC